MAAGVVCGKVTSVAEVFRHDQVLARGMSVDITDEFGRIATVAGDALNFSDITTWRAPRQPGADTAMVLQTVLGKSAEEITQLHDSGIVCAGDSRGSVPLQPREAGPAPTEPGAAGGRPLEGVSVLELNGDEPSKAFAAQLLADRARTSSASTALRVRCSSPTPTRCARPRSAPG
jgi:hypothetical protein